MLSRVPPIPPTGQAFSWDGHPIIALSYSHLTKVHPQVPEPQKPEGDKYFLPVSVICYIAIDNTQGSRYCVWLISLISEFIWEKNIRISKQSWWPWKSSVILGPRYLSFVFFKWLSRSHCHSQYQQCHVRGYAFNPNVYALSVPNSHPPTYTWHSPCLFVIVLKYCELLGG